MILSKKIITILILIFISFKLYPAGGPEKDNFHEGIAIAKIQGKWYFINKIGNILTGPIELDEDATYKPASTGWSHEPEADIDAPLYFSEGLVAIKHKDKIGFMNSEGKWKIEPQFISVNAFKEGLAVATKDKRKKKWGYINKMGEWVIEPTFSKAYSFSYGRARIKINNKYGYIDNKGNIIIEPQYNHAYNFTSGLALVEKVQWVGFININGEQVITVDSRAAYPFDEGLAAIFINNGWGFINTDGEIVIPSMDISVHFEEYFGFHNGLVCIYNYKDDQLLSSYYIDYNGEIIFRDIITEDIHLTLVGTFKQNQYILKNWKRDELYVVDFKKNIIIPAGKFDYIGEISDGLAIAQWDGTRGYINEKGDIIFTLPPE